MPEYIDPATGQIHVYSDAKVANPATAERIRARGLRLATPEEVDHRDRYLKAADTLSQLQASGELAVDAATFGAAGLGQASPEARMRREAFRGESPVLSGVVENTAALAPALAVGALTGGAGTAAGLSAQAASRAALLAESATLGTAVESEQAIEEGRGISVGNIVQGLALDVATMGVARLARGGARRLRGASAGIEAADDSVLNQVAQANRKSAERRSAGAAGTDSFGKPARRPHTEAEVEDYAHNREQYHRETDQVGADAIEDAVGGDAPAFKEVHDISLKRGDVVGRMADADPDAVLEFVVTQTERGEKLAGKLESAGHKQAANVIRDHLTRIDEALNSQEWAADTAIALDRYKRSLDDYWTKFSSHQTKANDPLRQRVLDLDEVLDNPRDGLRKGLENRKTWGKLWADKQLEENKIWSGGDDPLNGLINTGKVWQQEFRQPLAKGVKIRRGTEEMQVFKSRAEIVKHALGLPQRDFDNVMHAWGTWVERAREMNRVKSELAVQSIERTPIARLDRALNEMESTIEEIRSIRELDQRSVSKRKYLDSLPAAKGTARAVYETVRDIPGIGTPIKMAEAVPGAREKIAAMFTPAADAPLRAIDRDSALAAMKARQAERGKFQPAKSVGSKSAREKAEAYFANRATSGQKAVVGAGAAGAVIAGSGIAGADVRDDGSTPMTEALAELSDHSRAITERAALGLVAPASRPPRLESVLSRFQGDASSPQEAFYDAVDMLTQAQADPLAFVDGMTEGLGDIAAGGHSDLFERIVARVQVAVQYVLNNLPPSLSSSMARPDGAPPDTLALAEFAKIWSGAFRPGDVIYDISTGKATPTQIRALRQVHPDIYTELRVAVMRQIGQVRNVPFETKRKLDLLFDLDGAAGASFSTKFGQTMQNAAAIDRQPTKASLAGDSVLAPQSANSMFSKGPSSLK